MNRILLCLLFLSLAGPLAADQVEGYLIDKACAAKATTPEAAKAHTKDCALMPSCQSSGYGVVTADGKFLKFDAGGDRMAAKVLGFTGRADGLKVAVTGEVQGNMLIVKAIQLA